jgi:hypothetical protein
MSFLRYKNPVHTSQETHYVSAIEFSQLMLCKIWGLHDGDYEEWRLLGYYANVALVKSHVSEELSDYIIRMTRIVHPLLVMANVVLSSPILVTLMMKALSSSERPVLTRDTRRNIPEDAILHNLSFRNWNLLRERFLGSTVLWLTDCEIYGAHQLRRRFGKCVVIRVSEVMWETSRPAIGGENILHQKEIPWPLVRKRTITTEGPPLVGEI